jgi:hypothetical protein
MSTQTRHARQPRRQAMRVPNLWALVRAPVPLGLPQGSGERRAMRREGENQQLALGPGRCLPQ